MLPDDLASDILQFSESQFAKQYFSTHRTGFIFKRKVPVSQMMTWQKVKCRGICAGFGETYTCLDPTLNSPPSTHRQAPSQGSDQSLPIHPAHHG